MKLGVLLSSCVLFIGAWCLLLLFVRAETGSSTCSCTSVVVGNGVGVRSFLVDLQTEYDKLASLNGKLNRTIEILSTSTLNVGNSSSINITLVNSIIQLRSAQFKKIIDAQRSIAMEMFILSTQCNAFSGDNCDGYIFTCFNQNKNSSLACSGHGKCVGQDTCQCDPYFGGADCSLISLNTTDPLGKKYVDGSYAKSCKAYRNATLPYQYLGEGSGLYQIKPSNTVFTVYCDMDTMGGGWTLIMKTSSSQSKYGYYSTVWTSSSNANFSSQIDLNVDQDFVSPAFYNVTGTESMLAMGKLVNYNSWYHINDTAKNLANALTMSSGAYVKGICASQTNCGTQPINSLPSGVFQVITSGTYSFVSWNRFGYVNCNNPGSYGSSIRIGFSGDANDSDSSDTVMGIGLDCSNQCPIYSTNISGTKHNSGSGYYLYKTSATVPTNDKAERAWLWIRQNMFSINK